MTGRKPLDILIKTLQDRDIAADRANLQRAIESDRGPSIEEWINEYLGVDTLLSKDELSLYSALQKSGDVEALEQSQDISLIRGLSDQELHTAIEELKRSSATIEKQTEILRKQQDAMSSLVESSKQHYEARSAINKNQHNAWAKEFRTTSNAAEEILQGLKFQIVEVESQQKAVDAGLHKYAQEILSSDDKLLLSLQKLASDLQPNQPEDDEDAQRVRYLCARLIKYTVEDVRSRLDKIYLEATNSLPASANGEAVEDPEVTALREELESLYSEILPVAQMSAEQQYLEPALRAISAREAQGKHRSQKALTYVSECLTFLISRLGAFAARAEEYQSHRLATTLLLTTAHAELDAPPPTSPSKGKPSSTPTRRKNSKSKSKPTSPVRSRMTRRRSSATSFDDDMPAEQQLLRNLGISVPSGASERAVARVMADALADRTAKLALHAKSVQEGSEAAIASHLHDVHVTLDLLRETLLSETTHRTVRLMDREVEEAIAHLEAEVEDVKKILAAVDLEGLKERNVKRDELVERWSR